MITGFAPAFSGQQVKLAVLFLRVVSLSAAVGYAVLAH
jgi:hypothetical protein